MPPSLPHAHHIPIPDHAAPPPAGRAQGRRPVPLARRGPGRRGSSRRGGRGRGVPRASGAATAEGVRAPRLAFQASQPCAPGTFTNEATSFVEEHRIRGYEVGPDQTTTISTVANLLQEIAGNHSVGLWGRTDAGYATDPLMVERNLIFAATRMQIQMDRYPRWGDLVRLETWYQPEGRVAACRNWLITDALSNREIGRATSTWVMVNTLTRKLAKIPEEMRVKFQTLAPSPSRDAVPSAQARLKIPDLPKPPEIVGPTQVARRSDMDMNGHINNVTYLSWALETVPADIYLSHTLVEFEVDYKAECMAGDTVECWGGRAEPYSPGSGVARYLHVLQRSEGGRSFELVRARTTWRPRLAGPQSLAGD